MTANIKHIFDINTRLIGEIDKSIYYFRRQEYDRALDIVADSIQPMKDAADAIVNDRDYFNLVSTESVLEMFTGILEAKKNGDYILLADLLELQLMTFLFRVQELIIGKEEMSFDEDKYRDNVRMLLAHGSGFPEGMMESIHQGELLERGYRVEFTSTGLMTLAVEQDAGKTYYHTNCRIQLEAFLLANTIYRKGTGHYIIYGLGMGYHIRELKELAPEAKIEVYEADHNIIQLACVFARMGELLEGDNITIIYDPGMERIGERMDRMTGEEVLGIHYPSIKNVKHKIAKKIREDFYPWSKTLETC